MTLILTEAFEFPKQVTKWIGSGGATWFSGTGGRTGRHNGTGSPYNAVTHRLQASEEHVTLIAGMAVQATNWGGTGATEYTNCPLMFLSDAGATLHVAIRVETPFTAEIGRISAYRGGYGPTTGTLIGSVSPLAGWITTTSGWKYLEAKVTLHDTTGAVEVRVDGVTVLSLTNVDTKNGGTKTVFDTIGINTLCTSGATSGNIDDMYCCNGAGGLNDDFLGPVKIEILQPSADGASSGMTNSAGTSVSNYTYVDDTPAAGINTADYVQGLPSVKDTYTFANSAQTPTSLPVKGVAMHVYAGKVDATPVHLDTIARLSGTEDVKVPNPTTSLPTSGGSMVYSVYETKPGGGAWTVNDVNNAEFGTQVASP